MSVDTLNLALIIGAQLLTAGAIYGGIRADIQHLRRAAEENRRRTDNAHARIDSLLMQRGTLGTNETHHHHAHA